MKKANYTKAFGGVDPAFERRVLHTLQTIRIEEERRPMKKASFGLVFAVILCLLLSGIALAAARQWGLMDFFDKYGGSKMLPEATGLIAEPKDQIGGEGEFATFSVREALFDGHYVHLVVDAVPKEGMMLVTPDTMLTDPVSDLGKAFEGEKTTIGEYAKQNGLDKVVRVTFGNADERCYFSSIDNEALGDSRMVYEVSGSVEGGDLEELPIKLRCVQTEADNLGGKPSETVIEFTLRAERQPGVRSKDPVEFPEVGLRVDRVTLTGSPLVTHCQIEFAVTDRARWESVNHVLRFALLDQNGNKLDASMGGWDDYSGPVDEVTDLYAAERYYQTSPLVAMATLPDRITLAPQDFETDKLYPAQTIELIR